MADWKTIISQFNNSNSPNFGMGGSFNNPDVKGNVTLAGNQPIGCGVVGCWGTDAQGRKTLNGKVWLEPKQILCNDGSFDVQSQEPTMGMGKVAMVCNFKGGIAKNQPTPSAQTNKTKEPIYYIALTTGVLVAGYLLWKKYKK